MNFKGFLLRVLCGGVDIILIYVTSLVIIQTFFDLPLNFSDLYAQVIYVLYASIMSLTFKGQTLGKMIGKEKVIYRGGTEESFLIVGLRELAKGLYFLPVIGIPLFIVSMSLAFIGNGRMLHDYIGGSKVILTREARGIVW
ncbi:RDD family protein [Carnobacterium maltaromaticum]|uniref:RDD family protein n=1 Tax=Carnobacterium maltaromaticum TaxID=2751 RepID=UPI00295EB74D|nr:RDD family protein [Carnobacterium maltaromaticum]